MERAFEFTAHPHNRHDIAAKHTHTESTATGSVEKVWQRRTHNHFVVVQVQLRVLILKRDGLVSLFLQVLNYTTNERDTLRTTTQSLRQACNT